jgi:hypothetical protein
MDMPSLAEFQRGFAAALTAPALPGSVEGEAAGLRIHRNTFMKALVDAVLANYPTVVVLMGQEWVASAAQAYARQHPPRHAVLADYGASLPEFLRAAQTGEDWPYLPGVAELDRAWTQVLLARDAPALGPERLVALAPHALATLRPRLHPAVHYGVHGHSAVTVWRANRPPAVPPAHLQVGDDEEAALIVRNDAGVLLLPIDAAARTFLDVVIAGGDISAAASAALQTDPEADIAATWAMLLSQGAFADIETHGD